MKKIFAFAVVLFLGFNAKAQTTQFELNTESKITFKETEHNFGAQPQNKPVTYVFEFTNTGTQPLEVVDVKAACGCTTPDWTKTVVAPGQKGFVSAQYNMAREGSFRKSVTVKTKEGETVILYISGEATPVENSVDGTVPSIIAPEKP
jgi:hypothetical protein